MFLVISALGIMLLGIHLLITWEIKGCHQPLWELELHRLFSSRCAILQFLNKNSIERSKLWEAFSIQMFSVAWISLIPLFRAFFIPSFLSLSPLSCLFLPSPTPHRLSKNRNFPYLKSLLSQKPLPHFLNTLYQRSSHSPSVFLMLLTFSLQLVVRPAASLAPGGSASSLVSRYDTIIFDCSVGSDFLIPC